MALTNGRGLVLHWCHQISQYLLCSASSQHLLRHGPPVSLQMVATGAPHPLYIGFGVVIYC